MATTTGQRGGGPAASADAAPLPDGRDPRRLQRSPATALAAELESIGWLEPVAEKLAGVVSRALAAAGPRVTDALHGRQLGHALHPALTDLPIGMWAGSLLCDAAGEERAAGLLSTGVVASATAAAVTGFTDWSATDGRERRLALVHGLLNAGALGLAVGSLLARARGRRGPAAALSAAGFAIAGGSAWVGGELVYGRGLMVDHTAWTAGPPEWTAVLDATALGDGDMRGVDVDGRRVVLYRDAEGVHAIEGACSHAGGPLCEGELDGGVVTCPWHGSRFRLNDGSVVQGPATFPQLRLQTRVKDARIEVRGREG